MPHDDLLLTVATQRLHDDRLTAERHRLARQRLRAFSGRVSLDWRVVREHRVLVASVGFSWRRAPG